tara:strand:+ start:6541 stop:7641 length:1101 start_codon:yes stop_codon:yes gene_type:complete
MLNRRKTVAGLGFVSLGLLGYFLISGQDKQSDPNSTSKDTVSSDQKRQNVEILPQGTLIINQNQSYEKGDHILEEALGKEKYERLLHSKPWKNLKGLSAIASELAAIDMRSNYQVSRNPNLQFLADTISKNRDGIITQDEINNYQNQFGDNKFLWMPVIKDSDTRFSVYQDSKLHPSLSAAIASVSENKKSVLGRLNETCRHTLSKDQKDRIEASLKRAQDIVDKKYGITEIDGKPKMPTILDLLSYPPVNGIVNGTFNSHRIGFIKVDKGGRVLGYATGTWEGNLKWKSYLSRLEYDPTTIDKIAGLMKEEKIDMEIFKYAVIHMDEYALPNTGNFLHRMHYRRSLHLKKNSEKTFQRAKTILKK